MAEAEQRFETGEDLGDFQATLNTDYWQYAHSLLQAGIRRKSHIANAEDEDLAVLQLHIGDLRAKCISTRYVLFAGVCLYLTLLYHCLNSYCRVPCFLRRYFFLNKP